MDYTIDEQGRRVDADGKVIQHHDGKLYRCGPNGCGNVYLHEDVMKGGCPHCGARRCFFATSLTDKEAEYVQSRGYDLSENWQYHKGPND